MTKDMGALSGSRASTEPASSLGPSGFDPARMEARLTELLALEENWNSYHAKPIAPACAERVRKFYPLMETLGLQPWVTPDVHGGLTIECGRTDDYSIEFDPDGTVAVWFDGLSDADAWAFVGLFAQLTALNAASGMSAGTAETPQAAQGEARQPDPKGDAQPKGGSHAS